MITYVLYDKGLITDWRGGGALPRVFAGPDALQRWIQETPALRGFSVHGAMTSASTMSPWSDVLAAELMDPYPGFRVRLRSMGHYAPLQWDSRIYFGQSEAELARLAGAREAVFRALTDMLPQDRCFPGWSEFPSVPWEDAGDMPETGGGASSYRASARPRAVAVRAAPRGYRAFFWRFTYPTRPVDIAVTADHIYRLAEGRAQRVPRASLRTVVRYRSMNRWVFGRGTGLDLTSRPGCAVEHLLWEDLNGRQLPIVDMRPYEPAD